MSGVIPVSKQIDDAITDAETVRYSQGEWTTASDAVAVEEPLEIQIRGPQDSQYQSLSLTMRTPGNDRELAAGFLFNEGVVREPGDIEAIEAWGPLAGELKPRV